MYLRAFFFLLLFFAFCPIRFHVEYGNRGVERYGLEFDIDRGDGITLLDGQYGQEQDGIGTRTRAAIDH